MDLVLLTVFLAAVSALTALRLARLVVRSKVQMTRILLFNLVIFALLLFYSFNFSMQEAICCILGGSVVMISAAYAFLFYKKRQHNPNNIIFENVDKHQDGLEQQLEQNLLQFLHREESIKRWLYCQWFKSYSVQIIFLAIICVFFRLFS